MSRRGHRSFPSSSVGWQLVERPLARAPSAADRVRRRGPARRASTARASGVSCSTFRGARARCGSTPRASPSAKLFLTRTTCQRLRSVRESTRACRARLPARHRLGGGRPAAVPLAVLRPVVRHDLRRPDPGARELPHRGRHRRGGDELLRDPGNGLDGDQLGAPVDEAELLARAMEALEPKQDSDYATTECHAGLRLDLHPETPDFPTEHPIAPPLGGVASVSPDRQTP